MKDEDLSTLARDILDNKVYSNLNFSGGVDLALVFLPFGLMTKEEFSRFKGLKPALIYEYLEKALCRNINGNPVFMSFSFLREDDFIRLLFLLKDKQVIM